MMNQKMLPTSRKKFSPMLANFLQCDHRRRDQRLLGCFFLLFRHAEWKSASGREV